MLIWLEHMLNVGIDSIIVTLSRALVRIVAWFDVPAPTDLMCTLMRDWFRMTYALYHICGWGVSVSLALVDISFTIEGHERGVIETFI
jgi:hypothetical protein